MQVININSSDEVLIDSLDIAMGYFDGCHLGHQLLLKKLGNKKAVITFDKHMFKQSIFTLEQRIEQLKNYGVEYVYVLKMEVFVNVDKDSFIKFLQKSNCNKIIVGRDFKFGTNALGSIYDLKNNFNTTVINEHKYNGKKVSSSLLKEAFKDGDIKLVNKMLSRQYGVYGNVIVDQRLGNTIGFPTANILCTNQYIKYGVYVTNVLINGIIYKSITNVGIRPSVKDNSLRIETHIFDFNQDIYGKDIEVRFIDFIRNEVKFNSIEQLIEQIKKDVTFVKEYNGN